MKNIVVTGATGFIGRHLIHELLHEENNHVIAVVRENSKNRSKLEDSPNLDVIECSMEHISNLPKLVQNSIDIFYHLAWGGIRKEDRDNVQIQQNNYLNSIQTLLAAREMGVKRFIGVGSQAEYGACNGKITEESSTNPINEYGKAKLQFFHDGLNISQYLGINFVWGRVFSAYGPGDYENTLISVIIRNIKSQQEIKLGPSKHKWDFIHVSDVARALVSIQNAPSGAYNISGGDIRELRDYVSEIATITNAKKYIKFRNSVDNNDNKFGFEPDITKIKETCDWSPVVNFSDGIKRLFKN